MNVIHFFEEDVAFQFSDGKKTIHWLTAIGTNEGFVIKNLNYIFCSDDYLLEMNREYLDHDYYTDVITFDNSELDEEIEGDVFISLDRVRDNAATEAVSTEEELRRVLAHGLLHLCGYDDDSEEAKFTMREKENYYLSQF